MLKLIRRLRKLEKRKVVLILISIMLILGFFVLLFNVSPKILGFVVSETTEEIVEQSFDTGETSLEIKKPKEVLGNVIAVNKNKRMDFSLEKGKLRLYFDLLNYSEFVESVSEEIIKEQSGYGQEEIETGQQALITGFAVENNNESSEINLEELQEKLEELTDEEVESIEKESVVEIEEENFDVDVQKAQEKNYKWGYKVKLKDTKFLAKIDVTSDLQIKIIDNKTLRVGKDLLSFQDLEDAGYKVRIEKPSLEIEVEDLIVKDITINVTEEVNVSEVVEGINVTERVNVSEVNVSEVNITKPEVRDNITDINITLPENVTEEVNVSEVVEGINITEPEEVNVSEEVEEVVEEEVVNKTEEKQEKEEQAFKKTLTKREEKEEEEEIKEEDKLEKKQEKEEEEEQTGYGSGGITGGVVRFVGFIGRVVGVGDVAVEDIEYENTITIYIERDFSESGYEVGDVVELDPMLIILIIRAEHLDSNREFVNDIYDYVKNRDDNWSEVINNSHYVRVTFERNLTRINDITIFARLAGCVSNSSCSEGGEIAVYREDDDEEIARFMNISNENWYQILLTNLSEGENYDVFDLRVVSSVSNDTEASNLGIEFDYIVDPTYPAFIENFSNGDDFSQWDDNVNNTGWDNATDRVNSSAYSLKCATSANCNITSDDIDLSSALNFTLSFDYNDDDCDSQAPGDVLLYFYNGTDYVNIEMIDAGSLGTSDDVWNEYRTTFTDSQYFVSNFRLRFWAIQEEVEEMRITGLMM
jgi:hypothetical protein